MSTGKMQIAGASGVPPCYNCCMNTCCVHEPLVKEMSAPEVRIEVDEDEGRKSRFFKVPADQRKANPKAFEPYLFSFGPYQDAAGESYSLKDQVFRSVLKENQQKSLAQEIKKSLAAAHSRKKDKVSADQAFYMALMDVYPQLIPEEEKEASDSWNRYSAERMASDAIAIVAAQTILDGDGAAEVPALSRPMVEVLRSDALLLENQVPLTALRQAFESLQNRSSDEKERIFEKDVLHSYFQLANCFAKFEPANLVTFRSGCLLGAMYDLFTVCGDDADVKCTDDQKEESGDFQLLTASRLKRCWIKFQAAPGRGFSGITFNDKKKVLELPRIQVGDETIHFLHNLLAYEANRGLSKRCFVTSYCLFMDRLIDSAEDVRVLRKHGVIDNLLGSDQELADAWNKLCKFVAFWNTDKDLGVTQQLHTICKNPCRKWIADLETTFSEKPWLLISIAATAILFVLTVLQFVYAIVST